MGFPIVTPNGKRYLSYKKEMTYSDKEKEVNKILQEFDSYIIKNSHSYLVKRMLYTLGSYLLEGEKADVNSYKKKESILKRELPVSKLTNSAYESYFYGETLGNDEDNFFIGLKEPVDQHYIDYTVALIDEMYQYKKSKTMQKKYEDTRMHKLNLLRSCDDKYKEVTDDTVIIHKVNKDELPSFLANTKKFTGNIRTKKVLVHKARKGIIDKNTRYIVDVVRVDNENNIIFNNKLFKLDKSFGDFQKKEVTCYYIIDTDTYYFFDETVNNITEFVRLLDD